MTTTHPEQPVQPDAHSWPTHDIAVAGYATYAEAERAVDHLSDADFPVEHVSIAGRGVSTLETVTGRLTNGRAALGGAAAGVWTGLLLGLLLGLFVPGVAWFGVVVTGLLLGAAWGAALGYVGHRATRGRRDFSSVRTIVAERYEVMVAAPVAAEAQRLLGR